MSFSFRVNGPFTPATPAPTLQSFIGMVPSQFNIMPGWSANDGKTQYGPHTNFSDTTNVFTQLIGASVVAGQKSFDSTLSGYKLKEDTSNGQHYGWNLGGYSLPWQDVPLAFRFMVIAAPAGRTRIVVNWQANASAAYTFSCGFDLAGGNTSYGNSNGANLTNVATSMINLGSGFYACLIDWNYTLSSGPNLTFFNPRIYLDNGSGTAANSTSYTGDGTSGVNLVAWSMLPKCLWTKTWTRQYFDDFVNLSTIDLTNSKPASGKNWYIDTFNFPHSQPANFWGAVTPNAPVNSNVFTRPFASILRLLQINNVGGVTPWPRADWATSLMSVAYKSGTGLTSLVGQSFGGPLISDVFMQVGQATDLAVPNLTNNFAFWHTTTETLTSTNLNGSGNYIELDTVDGIQAHQSFSVPQASMAGNAIEWNSSGSNVGSANLGGSNLGTYGAPLIFDKFFRATTIWMPIGSTDAANWGFYMYAVNGEVSTGVGAAGGLFLYNNTSLNTFLVPGDTQHQCIILWAPGLGGGIGAPHVDFDWCAIWQ